MKEFSINISNHKEAINCILLGEDSDFLFLFVPGDGSTKKSHQNLGQKLAEKLRCHVLMFSFRGRESGEQYEPEQLVADLKEVTEHVLNKMKYSKITIICTSSGAVATTGLITDIKLGGKIYKAIYLDPADYYITEEGRQIHPDTWNGKENYQPVFPTVSGMLQSLKSDIIIDVANFTLRNSNGYSYVDFDERGIDNPTKLPRLNKDMVKSFYLNTPIKNRGEYIENAEIPHAFERDGDLERNDENIIRILKSLLS